MSTDVLTSISCKAPQIPFLDKCSLAIPNTLFPIVIPVTSLQPTHRGLKVKVGLLSMAEGKWASSDCMDAASCLLAASGQATYGSQCQTRQSRGEYEYSLRICLAWVYSSWPGLGPDCGPAKCQCPGQHAYLPSLHHDAVGAPARLLLSYDHA
eukprot:175430-Rhodomonas_salina.1